MLVNIANAIKKIKTPGKTGVNLRLRLQIYLFLFILVIFGVLITFIVGFDIFSPHKKVSALLQLQADRYEHNLTTYFNNTAAQGINFSRQLSAEIEKTLSSKKATFADVSDSQELITALEENTYSLLYNTLQIADCSGAFIILDATVNTKLSGARNSRAGTYLKFANVNTTRPTSGIILWARGVHDIGHANNLVFHNKWQLEFDVSRIPFYDFVLKNASKELVECYYYSPAFPFHGTWEEIMILCVPIVGKQGQVYGICGIEINSIYFKLLHAAAGADFDRVVGLVAQKKGDAILLDTGLEFGTKDGYFAGLAKGSLNRSPMQGLWHYHVASSSGGSPKEFVGLDKTLSLSPLSNKEVGSSWVAVCMIPKEDYDHMIYFSYFKFALFCGTFFAITLFLAYYISRRYNLPIMKGIHAIKEGSLHKTYINEIDDLMEFLAINDTVQNADMSAFYEFKENVKTLTRAETAVFNLHIEGYSAAKIAEMLYVSINTIKSHNKNIYRKLNISSRQELLLFAQMMKTSE